MKKNIKNNKLQNSVFKCRVVSKFKRNLVKLFSRQYWKNYVVPLISVIENLVIITDKLPNVISILKNIINIFTR